MEFEFLAFSQLIILSFSVVEFSEYRLLILLFYFGRVSSIYGCFPISTKLNLYWAQKYALYRHSLC